MPLRLYRSFLFPLLLLLSGLPLTAQAAPTTTPAATPAATATPTSTSSASANGSAMIILASGTQSLTLAETAILRNAAIAVYPDGATAAATMALLGAGIAAAHGAPAAGPYSITYDFSGQISMVPPPAPPAPPTPTWSTLAKEGQTVTLTAGTVVRFGAKAGTKFGADGSGAALAADTWSANIAIAATETIVVNAGTLGINDPVPGYVKELDVLSGTGSATLVK